MSNFKPLQARLADCEAQAPAQLVLVRGEIDRRITKITRMLKRYNDDSGSNKQFKISGAYDDYIMFNAERDVDIINKIIELLGEEYQMLTAQRNLLDSQIDMVNQVAASAFAVVASK